MIKALNKYLGASKENISTLHAKKQGLEIYKIEHEWTIVLLKAQISSEAHNEYFESAIDYLLEIDRKKLPSKHFGLAIDVNAILDGESKSFRKPLKKYSNSVIFEDLGIHILFFAKGEIIIHAESNEVNDLLINLDRRLKEAQ